MGHRWRGIRAAVAGLVAVGLLAGAGCGDDDEPASGNGNGGEAGEAGEVEDAAGGASDDGGFPVTV
jgi:hypothetical protein